MPHLAISPTQWATVTKQIEKRIESEHLYSESIRGRIQSMRPGSSMS